MSESHSSTSVDFYLRVMLPTHLAQLSMRGDQTSAARLFHLGRDERFLLSQQRQNQREGLKEEPSSPLQTLNLALQTAIQCDDPQQIAHFLVAVSRWSSRIAAESPLDVARAGNLRRALDLADLAIAENAVLWHLLLAWELIDAHREAEADQVLGLLRGMPLPRMDLHKETEAIDLLLWLSKHDEELFLDIASVVLGDNGKEELATRLVRAENPKLAAALARTIDSPYQQATSLAAAATALARAEAGEPLSAVFDQIKELLPQIDDLSQKARATWQFGCAWLEWFHQSPTSGLLGAVLRTAMANSYLTEALTLIRGVSDTSNSRAILLRDFAIAVNAAGNLDQALRALDSIGEQDNWNYKHEGIAAIAVSRARLAEFDSARQLLRRIRTHLIEYQQTVSAISLHLANAGRFDESLLLLDQFEPRDPYPDQREQTMVDIAMRIARSGDLERALTLVDRLQDAAIREEGRLLVAAEYASPQGEPAPAGRDITAAHDIQQQAMAKHQAADWTGPFTVSAALAELTWRTNHPSEALELWNGLLTGSAANSANVNETTVARLGLDQARYGATDLARISFKAAQDFPAREPGSDHRTRALWEVGTLAYRGGMEAEARNAFAAALLVPASRVGDWLGPLTLAQIAAKQAERGEAAAAHTTIGYCLERIDFTAGEYNFLASKPILGALIRLQEYELAAAAARQMPEGEGWEHALEIAEKLSTRGSPAIAYFDLAIELAEELFSSFVREDALMKIADTLVGFGAFDRALTALPADSPPWLFARINASIAIELAKANEINGAVSLAASLPGAAEYHRAMTGIAVVLSERGESEPAQMLMDLAEDAALQVRRPQESAQLLIETARINSQLGEAAAARRACEAALACAVQIDIDHVREGVYAKVAETAAPFDLEMALTIARQIEHPWVRGQTLLTLVGLSGQVDSREAILKIAEEIESPWWQAVLAAANSAFHSRQGDLDQARQCFIRAVDLAAGVPVGDDRDRLYETMAEVLIGAQEGERAVAIAERIITNQSTHAIRIGTQLAAKGDVASFKRLLAVAARYEDAAHLLCLGLADLYPNRTHLISAELAHANQGSAIAL